MTLKVWQKVPLHHCICSWSRIFYWRSQITATAIM